MTDKAYAKSPHAPGHYFLPNAIYIISARTIEKQRFFNSPDRLDLLQSIMFSRMERYDWRPHAWAFLSNHYHIVAQAPDDVLTLASLIRTVYSASTVELNHQDGTPGRKIWYQYWDTCITSERSYLARCHYVHQNAVKHGIVEVAVDYRWCSMKWLLSGADAAHRKSVLGFPCDDVRIEDDY